MSEADRIEALEKRVAITYDRQDVLRYYLLKAALPPAWIPEFEKMWVAATMGREL